MNIQQLPLNPCGGGKKPNYGTQLLGCSTPYLPIEVIYQILVLLPPKSIGRCRCVSKLWRALLSSPQFINAHTAIIKTRTMHTQSVSIFSERYWMDFTLTNHDQVTVSGAQHNLHLPMVTSLMASCDGLVLLLQNASRIFIMNPITLQTREIPTVITRCDVDPMTRSTTERITFDGIGFDSITNDYKVVSVSQFYNPQVDDSSHEVFVHIYSLNHGAWKTCISLPNFFGYRLRPFWSKGVFVGRYIHWLLQRATDGVPLIVAFDVVEEKLCQVPLPTHHSFQYMSLRYAYSLDVLAGCLSVSTMIRGYHNVWVMNKYGIQESWTRIARIEPIKNTLFMTLCLVGQDNLVLQCRKGNKLEKLVSYNVAEKTFKDVDIPDGIKELEYLTVPFSATMVSPYGMRGQC